jgi:hypothetical protein
LEVKNYHLQTVSSSGVFLLTSEQGKHFSIHFTS